MIRLAKVSRVYRSLPGRSVRALTDLSLDVPAGTILGLIGPNGAGKSTLLRLLLGYLRPTSGTITISDRSPRNYVQGKGIGYVPENVAIPPRWTVEGALRACAMLGNAGSDAQLRIDGALERLGLDSLRRRRVGSLSKGDLQRVAIAQAVLCDRDLLILDEPTDGLDPIWAAELRSIITEWHSASVGRTAIIASHDLAQIERIAHRVVVLRSGRVIADRPWTRGSPPLEELFLGLMSQPEAPA